MMQRHRKTVALALALAAGIAAGLLLDRRHSHLAPPDSIVERDFRLPTVPETTRPPIPVLQRIETTPYAERDGLREIVTIDSETSLRVSGALVLADDKLVAITDTSGSAKVPPADVKYAIVHGSYVPALVQSQRTPGKATVVELYRGRTIRGVTTDQDGRPLGRVRLEFACGSAPIADDEQYPVAEGWDPTLFAACSDTCLVQRRRFMSDENGKFEIRGMPSGPMLIRASKPGYVLSHGNAMCIPLKSSPQDIVVNPMLFRIYAGMIILHREEEPGRGIGSLPEGASHVITHSAPQGLAPCPASWAAENERIRRTLLRRADLDDSHFVQVIQLRAAKDSGLGDLPVRDRVQLKCAGGDRSRGVDILMVPVDEFAGEVSRIPCRCDFGSYGHADIEADGPVVLAGGLPGPTSYRPAATSGSTYTFFVPSGAYHMIADDARWLATPRSEDQITVHAGQRVKGRLSSGGAGRGRIEYEVVTESRVPTNSYIAVFHGPRKNITLVGSAVGSSARLTGDVGDYEVFLYDPAGAPISTSRLHVAAESPGILTLIMRTP